MPACVTVSVWSAMVAVSTCDEGEPFGGIVTVTAPLPVPLAGVAPSPVAVHGHVPAEAVIGMKAVPPAAGAVSSTGLIANEQSEPNCVTV